jgi:DNA repair exonuclease SbcCD ATPase subunit
VATNYALRFTQDIAGTKDVICPSIEVIYTQTFDESAEEKAVYDYFQKNAMKRVMKVAETALKPFQPAIKDTQKKIDNIKKLTKNLKTEKEWDALQGNLKALHTFTQIAGKLLEQGVKTVQGLINSELEQIEKDAIAYVKKKLKRDLTARIWKKNLKVVLVGTLTIAVAAAGIAATIATAGTGLAAVVGVASIAATIASAYGTVSTAIESDWENEKRAATRIEAYYKNLSKLTENLDEQLKALETHHKNRKKNLEKAVKTRNDLSTKYQNMSAPFPAQQKAKQAIADALEKSERALKKIEAVDVKIDALLKMGQQTRQYLGPLANGGNAAGDVIGAMKSGTSFVIEQSNTAVTIRDNLKNFAGGKEGSRIVLECQNILKKL